jgi:hypothetical protein
MMDAHRGHMISMQDVHIHREEITDTFQSYIKWQWYIVLFFDANNIFGGTWRVHLSQMSEARRIITMSELFHLDYVFRAWEGIQIVMDQFIEISVDRVVDGIIHYGGHMHIVPKSTLIEDIMKVVCDSPLAGNSGYSREYEAPQVTWILSREMFRLHIFLRYMEGDRDSIFLGAFWQDPNRATGTKLIPSTRFPPDAGILGVWLILTSMVTSMV